jgi:hypothetical protein
MSAISNVYAKARSEIIALFGWNVDKLSPDQTLRLDCAVALRLALDDLQGRVVRGESVDVARMLTAADALSRLLPAAALAAPPPEHRVDLRQVMWETYLGMRRRGEVPPEGLTAAKISALESEVEQLKVQLAGKTSEHSDIPTLVETVPVPAGDNVVKLPRLNPPAAPAAPQYDYNANQDWKNFVNPDSSIRSTTRGRWDV